jgi:hypothetical protein
MQGRRLAAEKHRQSPSIHWSKVLLGDDNTGGWGQNRCAFWVSQHPLIPLKNGPERVSIGRIG